MSGGQNRKVFFVTFVMEEKPIYTGPPPDSIRHYRVMITGAECRCTSVTEIAKTSRFSA